MPFPVFPDERILDQPVNPKLVFGSLYITLADVGFFFKSENKMDTTMIIVAGIIGVALGLFIAKIMEKKNASKILAGAKREATSIVKEAKTEGESIKKDKIFQAKEKFLELKAEHEKVIVAKDKKIAEIEKRTRDKEAQVTGELTRNKKLNDELETKLKDYEYRVEILDKKQAEVEKLHKSQVKQLEIISGLPAEEAKSQLIESLRADARSDAMSYVQNTLEEAKLTAQQEAKRSSSIPYSV